MKLIFIYGLPATGKLTVAQELASITGYKLFHNHLAVDLLLSVFEFGSPQFVALREQIWLGLRICVSKPAPWADFHLRTREYRPSRIHFEHHRSRHPQLLHNALCRANVSFPGIETAHRKPSRVRYQKLASISLFEKLHSEGAFEVFHMPKPAISIDTSVHTPAEAAAIIARFDAQ